MRPLPESRPVTLEELCDLLTSLQQAMLKAQKSELLLPDRCSIALYGSFMARFSVVERSLKAVTPIPTTRAHKY